MTGAIHGLHHIQGINLHFPGYFKFKHSKTQQKISKNQKKILQNSEEEKKLVPRHLWKYLFPTLIDASYVYYNGSILCQYIYIYLYSDTSGV